MVYYPLKTGQKSEQACRINGPIMAGSKAESTARSMIVREDRYAARQNYLYHWPIQS